MEKVEGRKGKFNLVDLAVVFVVLSLIVIAVYAMNLFGKAGTEVTLSYTVSIGNVDATYVDKIQVGDSVLDATTKCSLGRVAAVENTRPHTVFRYDETTGGKMLTVPDAYDVVVTVLAEGIFEDKIGYTVEQKRLAVGAEYTLLFPGFAGNGYCTSIREVG